MFSFSKIFKYLWLLIKRYKIAFFFIFILIISRIFFTMILIPYGYKSIIDILSLNGISITERYNSSILFLIPMGFGYLSTISINRYREYINARFIPRVIKDIYDFSFERIAEHSYGFYADNFAGSLVAKVKRFARAFETIHGAMVNFWFLIVLIISSTVMLYFQSKILALYVFVWAILYLIIILFLIKQKIKIDMKEAEADSKVTGILADSFTNIVNIKTFSALDREISYFKKFTTIMHDSISNAFLFSVKKGSFLSFWVVAFQVFILYTMINLWKDGYITLGVFVMTYTYIFAISDRMWDLSDLVTNFMKAMTDMKEVVDIFETKTEIKDIQNPEICQIKEGNIEFNNVTFSYNEDGAVFKNFNLKIHKGEKVGLVGYSGSGKTTITKLLLRFIDVDNGEILIDGQNIAKIKQDDLRKSISYVPQESILFHRSIKENIGYSKDNAIDEEIIKAAVQAHANDFINNLPNKYNTLVGERGIKLSGGERQRVSIARAMLKNSPILILDEATSSLDSNSEHFIQESFAKLMENRTTIVIAHRLSTVEKMDRIIVLDKTGIIEEGTHKQLLKKKGVYADLWAHQNGGFIE